MTLAAVYQGVAKQEAVVVASAAAQKEELVVVAPMAGCQGRSSSRTSRCLRQNST